MSVIGRYTPGTGAAPIETITGNIGGAVGPSGVGNINFTGTAPITITGNPGANSLDTAIAGSTEFVVGAVRLATAAETTTGTSVVLAVDPARLNTKLGPQTANALIYGQGGAGTNLASLAAATNGQLPIGNTGNPPTLATLTAGAGIAIANGAGTITITSIDTGLEWTVIAANTVAASGNGYFTNGGGMLSITLPAVSAVGDTFEVAAMAATGWRIVQGGGQQIRVGNLTTTLGVGGALISIQQGDWITLVCNVANTSWMCKVEQGNVTVV